MNHQPGLLIKCLIRNAELKVDLSDSSGAPLLGVGNRVPHAITVGPGRADRRLGQIAPPGCQIRPAVPNRTNASPGPAPDFQNASADGGQQFETAPHSRGAPISCDDVDNVPVSEDGCGVVERYIHRGGGHLASVGEGHTCSSEQVGGALRTDAELISRPAGRGARAARWGLRSHVDRMTAHASLAIDKLSALGCPHSSSKSLFASPLNLAVASRIMHGHPLPNQAGSGTTRLPHRGWPANPAAL